MRGIRLKLSTIEFVVLINALNNESKKSAHIKVVCDRVRDRLLSKKSTWEERERIKNERTMV